MGDFECLVNKVRKDEIVFVIIRLFFYKSRGILHVVVELVELDDGNVKDLEVGRWFVLSAANTVLVFAKKK